MDKTSDEIGEAYYNGKTVILKIPEYDTEYQYDGELFYKINIGTSGSHGIKSIYTTVIGEPTQPDLTWGVSYKEVWQLADFENTNLTN